MCDVGAEEMPAEEEESEGEIGSENGEVSSKQKYRALKRRLKYLSYEHECFENDVQKAQTKLLQLARDKSFLLDQLTRYEAVVISDDDETDYSSIEEDASTLPVSPQMPTEPPPLLSQDVVSRSQTAGKSPLVSHGPPNVVVGHQLPHTPKGTVVKSAAAILSLPSTDASLGAGTTTTVSKATGGVKPATAKKATKASGGGGGGGKKLSASVAARITKTVAKARAQPAILPVAQQPMSPLIVSFPLNIKTSTHNTTQEHSTPEKQVQQEEEEPVLPPRPTEALPPAPPQLVSQKPLPSGGPGAIGLSSSSSSSGSSSSSDSDDSGSQSSSSSSEDEDEPMDVGGPVPMVNKVGATPSSTPLLRPKAITSPVKVPPQLIQVFGGSGSGHPPALSPLTSPPRLGGFSWSNRPQDASTGSSSHGEVGGFVPIVPPLSSPPSTPPIGLGTSSAGSAFQKVSPKVYHAESSKQPST